MSSSSSRISISSDEVNILIYRYLIEAGFKHTAFVFHGESLLQRSPNLVNADMPPGALVSLLQKALLFLYVESHISNDGKQIPCDEAFSLFKPHDHEHGPIEAPIQFEPGFFDGVSGLKRTEMNEESLRPSKKPKSQTVKKSEDATESGSLPYADDAEIPEQVGQVESSIELEPARANEDQAAAIDGDQPLKAGKADSDREMVDEKEHPSVEN